MEQGNKGKERSVEKKPLYYSHVSTWWKSYTSCFKTSYI